MGVWADELIAELDGLKQWPPRKHYKALQRVSRGIAMRERDVPSLRHMAGWDRGRRNDQRFLTDPMPSRISSAFSSLIFGRTPKITPAKDADQTRMDDLVEENNFRSEFGRGARTASSEGEVWWRIYADEDVADHPLLEWHSRTSVYPLWRGRKLLAVAFVSRLEDFAGFHWRHFEIHEVVPSRGDIQGGGRVQHVLYKEPASRVEDTIVDDLAPVPGRGAPDAPEDKPVQTAGRRLGQRVNDLNAHPETEGMDPVWNHGLPGMLAGRVANLIGSDPTVGVSDYWDPEDLLIELNVASSIAHGNLELTARKRVIVPETEVKSDPGNEGEVDIGEQVYIEGALDEEMGGGNSGGGGGKFKVLEYSFDADALIAYKRETEITALNRCGIDAQYAGLEAAQGNADSGVALRIRLIPSQHAGEERAEEWDVELPKAIRMMQLLESLSREKGGFGRTWSGADEKPDVDRGESLPEDRTEATTRRAEAVDARIMSRKTAVEEDHPEWTDENVKEELDLIDKDAASATPTFGGTLPPGQRSPDQQGTGPDPGDPEAAAADGSQKTADKPGQQAPGSVTG